MTHRKSNLYRGGFLASILVAGALVGCNQGGGQGGDGEGGGGEQQSEFVLPLVPASASSLKSATRRRRTEPLRRARRV